MRIFYHAIDGTGLGHLMRLSAIAVAVRREAPHVHQLIATNAIHEEHLGQLEIPFLTLPRDDSGPLLGLARQARTVSSDMAGRMLLHAVREYDPDVVVFDTHAPPRVVSEARREGRETILVLRRCRPKALEDSLDAGRLTDFTMVLAPYTADEFAHGQPRDLLDRLEELGTLRHTGGIAFDIPLDRSSVDASAENLGVSAGEPVILITSGSGGYGALNGRFVDTATRAALGLRDSLPALRTISVAGPYARGRPAPEGCVHVTSVRSLQPLMARADLVVAHAGYNSIQEVRRTGARAVLVPIYRKSEDQASFAELLAARGGVRVLEPEAPVAAFAAAYHELLGSPRPAPEAMSGAATAAAMILRKAGSPVRFLLSATDEVFPGTVRCVTAGELAGAILAEESPALVRVDWDRTWDLLSALGPAFHTTVAGLEIDAGSADPPTWENRIRMADAVVGSLGVDRTTLVVSIDDASGGWATAALAGRIRDLRLKALTARIPPGLLRDSPASVVQAADVCRDLKLPFTIDLRAVDGSFASVDQR